MTKREYYELGKEVIMIWLVGAFFYSFAILHNVYETVNIVRDNVETLMIDLSREGVNAVKEEYGDEIKVVANELKDSTLTRIKRWVK